jgi:2-C-methyl-D-erythritol 2,4-cyclodiphosphate synthase
MTVPAYPFRIGFGHDVHRLTEGIPLVVGGVIIPWHKGPVGHSDGDVLIHALMDALLGAAGLRDIGSQFPDTEPALRGISSLVLLQRTMKLVSDAGFRVGNVDATVCLQEPRLSPHIPQMIGRLAPLLGVEASRVSVKATTTEHLGFAGRGEGISASAVALLYAAE